MREGSLPLLSRESYLEDYLVKKIFLDASRYFQSSLRHVTETQHIHLEDESVYILSFFQ